MIAYKVEVISSLPHRQLRKQAHPIQLAVRRSLPHRQLRKAVQPVPAET